MSGRGGHQPIRVTPTFAGPDSKGIVSIFGWELEGMVAFYLVAGLLVGMLLAFTLVGRPVALRIGAGLAPVVVSAVWIRVFLHGKPPAYQGDVLETWRRGADFRLAPQRWCRQRHPRELLEARLRSGRTRHG